MLIKLLLEVVVLCLFAWDKPAPPQLLTSRAAREAVVRQCDVQELSHVHSWGVFYGHDLRYSLDYARTAWQQYCDLPSVRWMHLLPDHDAVCRAKCMQDDLSDYWSSRLEEVTLSETAHFRRDLHYCIEVYNYMDAAHRAQSYIARREALDGLRCIVGDATFVTGNWPAPLPLWAVPATKRPSR